MIMSKHLMRRFFALLLAVLALVSQMHAGSAAFAMEESYDSRESDETEEGEEDLPGQEDKTEDAEQDTEKPVLHTIYYDYTPVTGTITVTAAAAARTVEQTEDGRIRLTPSESPQETEPVDPPEAPVVLFEVIAGESVRVRYTLDEDVYSELRIRGSDGTEYPAEEYIQQGGVCEEIFTMPDQDIAVSFTVPEEQHKEEDHEIETEEEHEEEEEVPAGEEPAVVEETEEESGAEHEPAEQPEQNAEMAEPADRIRLAAAAVKAASSVTVSAPGDWTDGTRQDWISSGNPEYTALFVNESNWIPAYCANMTKDFSGYATMNLITATAAGKISGMEWVKDYNLRMRAAWILIHGLNTEVKTALYSGDDTVYGKYGVTQLLLWCNAYGYWDNSTKMTAARKNAMNHTAGSMSSSAIGKYWDSVVKAVNADYNKSLNTAGYRWPDISIYSKSGQQEMLLTGTDRSLNVRVEKTMKNFPTTADADNSLYSVYGTEFTFYRTKDDATNGTNALGKVTFSAKSASGNTPVVAKSTTLTFNGAPGTYWYKETKPGKGLKNSVSTPKSVKLKEDTTNEVSASDVEIVFTPKTITKLDYTTNKPLPSGYSAIFKVEYWKSKTKNVTASTTDPNATWYFQTDADGVIKLSDPTYLAAKPKSSALYTLNDKAYWPLGAYRVTEYSVTKGYQKTDQIYYALVTAKDDNSGANIAWSPSQPTKVTNMPDQDIVISKSSSNTVITENNSLYSLEGTVIGIFTDEACSGQYGSVTLDEEGRGTLLNVTPGTYYYREIESGTGYLMDTEIHGPITVSTGTDAEIELTNVPASGEGRIIKIDPDGETITGSAPVFCIEYFVESDETKLDDAAAGRIWYIRGNAETGVADLEDADRYLDEWTDPESGTKYMSDERFPSEEAGKVLLPLGIYRIREIEAPAGYEHYSEPFVLKVSSSKAADKQTVISSTWTTEESEELIYRDGLPGPAYLVNTMNNPEISTKAFDFMTNDHVGTVAENAKILDEVSFSGLQKGKVYVIKGKLVDASTGDIIQNNGQEAASEISFTAESSNGTVTVPFSLDTADIAGKTVVVYENLYYGDELIASHEDITDEGQSIHYPKVRTTAKDKESNTTTAKPEESVTIVDTVQYENLVPGKEYVLEGTLMSKATGEPVKSDGDNVTSSVLFTPEEADGTVTVEFTFNGHATADQYLVVFENLLYQNAEVYVHADITDEEQTVYVDQIKTDLTITKAVTGNLGNKAQEFIFKITASYKDNPVVGSFDAVDEEGNKKTVTFDSDGKATVKLTHGQSLIIKDLHVGTEYEIEEKNADDYRVTGERNGTLIDGINQVDFTNDRTGIVPTGIFLRIKPYLVLIMFSGLTAFLLMWREKTL